jgi:cell division control protein 6
LRGKKIMSGHCTDSIFKDREVLSSRYIPDYMPNRMDEIKTISQIIDESLDGKVTHILISGPPGTGKTAAIKLIFKAMKEDTNALLCYVNCFNKRTRMGALYSMVLDFFKEKRPTRKMPSRRGIAYDEMLDSFSKELEKTNTRVVVCLDEVDQLEETELIHDLIRTRWESGHIQIIGISNNPFIFKDLDPRTKSRLYPLREISFYPYDKEQMREIVEVKVEAAFQEDVVDKEAIEFLAKFMTEKKGDVRVARETLLRAGDLANNSGEKKLKVKHMKERINRTSHAKAITVINGLSRLERFILRLIPNKGAHFPQLYQFYKATDGKLGDRMFRNYIERFSKLNLIHMELKGEGGSYFITLNTPKDVLFEGA